MFDFTVDPQLGILPTVFIILAGIGGIIFLQSELKKIPLTIIAVIAYISLVAYMVIGMINHHNENKEFQEALETQITEEYGVVPIIHYYDFEFDDDYPKEISVYQGDTYYSKAYLVDYNPNTEEFSLVIDSSKTDVKAPSPEELKENAS